MSNSFTMVDIAGAKSGPISIKPFFDSKVNNMGLEKYGLSLFEGVFHEEQLACIEQNGIKRYVTGLNEFAPEVKLIRDPDAKAARIKEIRTVVSELEKEMAANVIEVDDPQFWNKVKLLKPDNSEFWNRISVACGNEPLFLDPKDRALWKESFLLVAESSARVSERSRSWVREAWSLERQAKAMDAVYRDCLGIS